LFIFTADPEIVIYNGNYSDFKVEQEEKAKAEKTKIEKSTVEKTEPSKVVNAQKSLSFKEEQEIVSLEKEIETLEETIKEKTIEMNGASDHNILQKIGEEIQALTDTLEAKSDRWLELLERKG
jgi:ATP-binding cassette subfamily F protein uup